MMESGSAVWVHHNGRRLEGVLVRRGERPYELIIRVGGPDKKMRVRELIVHEINVEPRDA